jgi:hypothetical protein
MGFGDRFLKKGNTGRILGEKLFSDSHDGTSQKQTSYSFKTGIAKEVISNPYQFLSQIVDENDNITLKDYLTKNLKIELEEGKLFSTGVKNEALMENMPMNSIITYIVDDSESRDSGQTVVAYPFFPSHLSFPVKTGEYVWIIKEDIKGLDYYYWLCRKPSIIQNEDVNYTNHERLPEIVKLFDKYESQQGASDIDEEELLAATTLEKNIKGNFPANINVSTDLFQSSFSFLNEHTGEPVPRLKKDCDDLLLQGSNNAGLHITKEKFKTPSLNPADMTNKFSSSDVIGTRKPQSPALDLYVHRKYSDLIPASIESDSILQTDRLNLIHNTSIDEKFSHYEINKSAELTTNDEFASINEIIDTEEDATDVAGRIYISSNCEYDSVFNSSFDVLSAESGPAAILFGKNARVIAENSLRLTSNLGESFIDITADGNIVLKSSINDGQQFLSLANNGVTRLQAKNKIELAVRSDNTAPDEPYVLYTNLKDLLEKILQDISTINEILSLAKEAAGTIAPVIPIIEAVDQGIGAAGGSQIGEGNIKLANLQLLIQQYFNVTGTNPIPSTKIFGE